MAGVARWGYCAALGGGSVSPTVCCARAKGKMAIGARATTGDAARLGRHPLVGGGTEIARRGMSWARTLAAGPTVALRGIKTVANLVRAVVDRRADAHQNEVNNMMWACGIQKERDREAFAKARSGLGYFRGD